MSWQHDICEKLGGTLGLRKMENAMYSILKEMLEVGCDPNEKAWSFDDFPVWVSILDDKEVPLSIIRLFLDHGARIPQETSADNSVLFKALKNEFSTGVIALLLDHGADATLVTDENVTALHYACDRETDSLETIKLLVEHGCPVDLKRQSDGATPLSIACILEKDIEILQYLLDMEADVNSIDDDGDTPLMGLCYRSYGASDKVKLLLERGAAIDVKNNKGFTALGILCRKFGDPDMVQVLVEHGLDVNSIEDSWTMAMLAAQAENWETIEKLVTLGFDRFDFIDQQTGSTIFDLVTDEESLNLLHELSIR